MTHHGRIVSSFWTVSGDSYNSVTDKEILEMMDPSLASRLVIIPRNSTTHPFCVTFDYNPYLDPTPIISYQAIIPKDSLVFRIIASGQIEELVRALETGPDRVSLAFCDEEGRSPLNVSYRRSFENTN
jgi:hypothetical protein